MASLEARGDVCEAILSRAYASKWKGAFCDRIHKIGRIYRSKKILFIL
jgi:hypothetical protein